MRRPRAGRPVASGQLIRQWALLRELGVSRVGRTLAELARAGECSQRTARRDLGDLETAGFPLERIRDPEDGRTLRHRLIPGHHLPEVPLGLDQALALHHAALTASLFENPAYHQPLEEALRALRGAFPAPVRAYLDRFAVAFSHRSSRRRSPQLFHTIRVLQEQIRDRCRVRFVYRNLKGEEALRTADPYLLRLYRGDLYLLALCHLRGEVRSFHLERIDDVEPLDDGFRLPAGFDPEGEFAGSLGVFLGEPGQATVEFRDEAARYVAQRPLHPDQQVLHHSENRLVVRVPHRGYQEITQEVLRFGGQAEVLQPPELREHVAQEVRKLFEAYTGCSVISEGGG